MPSEVALNYLGERGILMSSGRIFICMARKAKKKKVQSLSHDSARELFTETYHELRLQGRVREMDYMDFDIFCKATQGGNVPSCLERRLGLHNYRPVEILVCRISPELSSQL